MSASMNIFVRVGGAAAATGAVLYAFSNQSAEASAAKKQLQRRPSWEAKFDGSQQREAVAAAASALDEGANKRLQRRPSWAAKCAQCQSIALIATPVAHPRPPPQVRGRRAELGGAGAQPARGSHDAAESGRHDAPA